MDIILYSVSLELNKGKRALCCNTFEVSNIFIFLRTICRDQQRA